MVLFKEKTKGTDWILPNHQVNDKNLIFKRFLVQIIKIYSGLKLRTNEIINIQTEKLNFTLVSIDVT